MWRRCPTSSGATRWFGWHQNSQKQSGANRYNFQKRNSFAPHFSSAHLLFSSYRSIKRERFGLSGFRISIFHFFQLCTNCMDLLLLSDFLWYRVTSFLSNSNLSHVRFPSRSGQGTSPIPSQPNPRSHSCRALCSQSATMDKPQIRFENGLTSILL